MHATLADLHHVPMLLRVGHQPGRVNAGEADDDKGGEEGHHGKQGEDAKCKHWVLSFGRKHRTRRRAPAPKMRNVRSGSEPGRNDNAESSRKTAEEDGLR